MNGAPRWVIGGRNLTPPMRKSAHEWGTQMDGWGTRPLYNFIQTTAKLLLDAGDVADGAAGGAGGHCGVGLQGLRDFARAGCGLPRGRALGFHGGAALGEFRVGEVDAEDALGDVDLDGVALFDQGDGAAFRSFGRDVADAEPGGCRRRSGRR